MDPLPANTWMADGPALAVLGTGHALPGLPLTTGELTARLAERFGVDLTRKASAIGRRLNIRHRHLARDFADRREGTRPGEGNPELAARAVRAALDQAGLRPEDLAYLIGHTTTPAEPVPSNVSRVAHLLGYRGPVAEFRQACTGFVNATLFAAGLCGTGRGGRPVAVVGSETGSVFFDPARAAEDFAQLVNFVQMGDGAGAIILGGEPRHAAHPAFVPVLPRAVGHPAGPGPVHADGRVATSPFARWPGGVRARARLRARTWRPALPRRAVGGARPRG